MKKIIIILIIFIHTNNTFCQDLPKFEITTYRDTNNNLFWNKQMPVNLFIAENTNKEKLHTLEGKTASKNNEKIYFTNEGKNYIYTKYSISNNKQQNIPTNQQITWEIYVDGTAPTTKAKFISNNTKKNEIYGKNLKIELNSSDKTSKVKNIYYSLNSQPYQIYNKTIEITHEGQNTIKYFAVDNVGNAEKPTTKKFTFDITTPNSSIKITNANSNNTILSLNSKISIHTNEKNAGIKKIYYQIDNYPKVLYKNDSKISLEKLSDGQHTIKYYATDNVNNTEKIKTYTFYLDRTPPITVSDVLGDKFVVGDKIYFSGRTKLKITSIDNKSGVKDILYSIDNSEFTKYTDPFYMPNEPGIHIVKYFATDSTENITKDQYTQKYLEYKLKVDKIYVDLTGPVLNHFISGQTYERHDTTFIGKNSKINLQGKDKEAQLHHIAYSLDGELRENIYNKPFCIKNVKTGKHKIEYFGYDNVNNRNKKTFYVIYDNSGPKIDHKFSTKSRAFEKKLKIFPKDVLIFISATDDITQVKEIFYSINNSKKIPYKNYITGFKNGENTIKIDAYDIFDNKTSTTVTFFAK